ncbi:MAG: transporter substrate-binding domain-containing protein [Atopobiaceae bacterium]|jgi:signal transduction histidine kinase/BarA-like signal transduction histidine kinase|nr:transporter substrate-binding domain-containing protein [Atopobiaceae bacterium]
MSMRRGLPRPLRLCLLAAATALALLGVPVAARADDAPTTGTGSNVVRVGISEYPQYAYYDANGNPTGADVEYAYRIAQYEGLDVQVVLIPDASSYFSALDSGQVDMLFDVIKTDEREQRYLFAEYQTGSTPNSIYVRKGDTRFEYGDTETLNGKVFGSERGSYVTTIFKDWCASVGIAPRILEYANSDEVNAALDAGEVDAGVYGDSEMAGYTTVERFSPTPYYSIFRRDETALKAKVDEAMSRILSEDPLYGSRLVEKYVGSTNSTMSTLSAEESDYVASHPAVTVAAIDGDAPYYWVSADGKARGVLVDYCAKLGQLTGLSFDIVSYPSQAEAEAAVRGGQCDMVGIYSNGLVKAYSSGFALTRTYATEDVVELTRSGVSSSDVKRIAVKERSRKGFEDTLGIEGVEYVGYESASACFAALESGQVDAVIAGQPSITYLVNQADSAAYSIDPVPQLTMEMCGAVAADNGVLCSILDKAVAVSSSDFDAYVSTSTMTENNLRSFVAHMPPGLIVGVGLVLAVLVVGLVVALFVIVRHQRETVELARAKVANDRREAQLAAAERANDDRNRFFSNISHDMRTPLNAIIGFSSLAQKKARSPEVKDYLGKIETSGNVLLDLIDDTLMVSKMSSGKVQINPQPIALAELVESITIPIQEFALQHGVEFAEDVSARPRAVLCDRLNTEKIMLNLLTNAVKYTPRGGHVRFSIADAPGDASDPDLVFTVADDGVGMADSFLPHIYEPFIQENKLGTTSGTGLGLSIVKQLVDLMGGTIEVRSKPGEGTTFLVRLHLAAADEVPNAHPEAACQVSGVELSGRKVLLCEDNAMNAEIARALLEEEGIEVVVATNGRVGVRYFEASEAGEYSAVLMDLRMPVMDGLEAARRIRALDRKDAASVPIVAMTADAFPDDVERCLDAGMNAHVAKPIDPNALMTTLREQMSRR